MPRQNPQIQYCKNYSILSQFLVEFPADKVCIKETNWLQVKHFP